jgi:hypothetical protein
LSPLEAALLLAFCHLRSPLDPGFEGAYVHCFVSLIENRNDRLQEVWRAPTIVVSHCFIEILKEEEVIRNTLFPGKARSTHSL